MEIHIYLNGQLLRRTGLPRERVVSWMQERLGASLWREAVIRTPRQPKAYLKMRFVSSERLPSSAVQHLGSGLEAELPPPPPPSRSRRKQAGLSGKL